MFVGAEAASEDAEAVEDDTAAREVVLSVATTARSLTVSLPSDAWDMSSQDDHTDGK